MDMRHLHSEDVASKAWREAAALRLVGVGWVLATPGSLLFLGVGVTGMAQMTYEVRGVVEHTIPGSPGLWLVDAFRVQIQDHRWIIEVSAGLSSNWARFGWDGRYAWWEQAGGPHRKEHELVLRRSPVPAFDSVDWIGPVWLSLCSGLYFRDLTVPLAEPPVRGHLSSGSGQRSMDSSVRFHVDVAAHEGSAPFQLPRRVMYYHEPYPEGGGRRPALGRVRRRCAVASEFEVISWTNVAGTTLPLQTRYVIRQVRGVDARHDPTLAEYRVRVEEVDLLSSDPPLRPRFQTNTLVRDFRFPETGRYLRYQSMHWLAPAETHALPEYREAMAAYRNELTERRFRRQLHYGLVALAGLGTTAVLVLVTRRLRLPINRT